MFSEAEEAALAGTIAQMNVELKRVLDERREARLALEHKQESTYEQMLDEGRASSSAGETNPRYSTHDRKVFWDFQRLTLPRRARPRPQAGYECLEDKSPRYSGK